MDLLLRAGPLLWPILALSIAGLGLSLHRLFYFAAARRQNRQALRRVLPLITAGRLADAAGECSGARGPVAGVLSALLSRWGAERAARRDFVGIAAERELRAVEWGLRPLALIARAAPLVGLLGTVLGLVEAFIAFSSGRGPPDPAVLAGGIWQALLTTVAGLVVAIPAMFAHEWCESQADAQLFAMKEALAEAEAAAP